MQVASQPELVLRLARIIVLASLCASCGGGGGGGGGGGALSFSLSTTNVAFSATENGTTPANQTVVATALNGTVYFSISATGSALASATLNCSGSTCQIELVPVAPVGITPGTLSSTVVVSGCTTQGACGAQVGNSPQTINVSYVISSGPVLSSNPSALGLQTTPSMAPQPQTVALATSMATTWSSSVTYLAGGNGWLNVPSSGNAPGNVSIGVGALPVGAYRAQVTFTPTGGGGTVSILVVAVSHDTGLSYVAPYVGTAGTAQPTILRGSGFSSLSAAQAQVLFGTTAGTNVQVINDSEIKVTAPALASGEYAVSVKDNSQTLAGTPSMVVVSAPGYAYAKIPRSANTDSVVPGHLIYDAQRGAIYLYDVDTGGPSTGTQYSDEIERYQFSLGTWNGDVLYAFSPLGQQPTPDPGALALAPNGNSLVRLGYTTVDQVDPAAGTLLASTNVSDTFGIPNYQVNVWRGAMTNNGMLLGTAIVSGPISLPTLPGFTYFYDVPTGAFLPAPQAPNGQDISQFTFTGAGDGSTVLATEGGALPTAFVVYDAGSATYPISGGLGTLNSSLASLSRDGTRALMHADTTRYAVVDFGSGVSHLVGYLPPPAADALVISPDGTRAYTFVESANTLHVYDLTAAVDGNAQYPEIGTGLALVDTPSASGTSVAMIITPDGGTLILAGSSNVIVTPKPPG